MKFKLLMASFFLALSVNTSAEQASGLNVLLTSADRQTQMMAMVLSVQTLNKHNKQVNLLLCGAAGDLAMKSTNTETFKPSNKSPTMLLKAILSKGAKVELCPLYLPNGNATKDQLIDGITVAKPPEVAARLLDTSFKNLSY